MLSTEDSKYFVFKYDFEHLLSTADRMHAFIQPKNPVTLPIKQAEYELINQQQHLCFLIMSKWIIYFTFSTNIPKSMCINCLDKCIISVVLLLLQRNI